VPPERRQALESYRAKRRTWLAWIENDEDHAIWTTLSAMVWNDVSFRTLADFATADEQGPLATSQIAERLINGDVATQVLCTLVKESSKLTTTKIRHSASRPLAFA
jgi:hypothetical protein